MTASAPVSFSPIKFVRSLIGLVLAPVAGGGITMALWAIASIAWVAANGKAQGQEIEYLTGAIEFGLAVGLQLGVLPALILGWPMHLLLMRTGFIHLQTYFTFGAALAVASFLIITRLWMSSSTDNALPFEVSLIVAAAGAVGATIFWFIRRPDRDVPEPTGSPPPELQSQ